MNESGYDKKGDSGFRRYLAQTLKDIRSSGNKADTQRAKTTLDFFKRIIRTPAEKTFVRGSKENISKTMQEGTWLVSNEPLLFETFPYIHEKNGIAIGVGFDQMLDIAVNSSIDEVYIIDIHPDVSVATQIALEIGKRHRQLYNVDPTPEAYVRYFAEDQLPLTLRMLEGSLSVEQLKYVKKVLYQRFPNNPTDEGKKPPLKMHHYLNYISRNPLHKSWISSPENIAHILDMYARGAIMPVCADITDIVAYEKLRQSVEQKGKKVSVLYLSNAPTYISLNDRDRDMSAALRELPFGEESIVLWTDIKQGEPTTDPPAWAADDALRSWSLPWVFHIGTPNSFLEGRDPTNYHFSYIALHEVSKK